MHRNIWEATRVLENGCRRREDSSRLRTCAEGKAVWYKPRNEGAACQFVFDGATTQQSEVQRIQLHCGASEVSCSTCCLLREITKPGAHVHCPAGKCCPKRWKHFDLEQFI